MCYNIIHGNNCLNPKTFFILNYSAITRGYSLRISVHLATLNVRQHFFATRVTPIWNSLPTEIVTAPSAQQFRYGLIRTDLSMQIPRFPHILWQIIHPTENEYFPCFHCIIHRPLILNIDITNVYNKCTYYFYEPMYIVHNCFYCLL